MRQVELYRMGIEEPTKPDIALIEHIDKMAKYRRAYNKQYKRARRVASKVLCPRCFNHVRLVRNYSNTNTLYDCTICGFSWSKHEVFGTMAKDV